MLPSTQAAGRVSSRSTPIRSSHSSRPSGVRPKLSRPRPLGVRLGPSRKLRRQLLVGEVAVAKASVQRAEVRQKVRPSMAGW